LSLFILALRRPSRTHTIPRFQFKFSLALIYLAL
jgi:hypothetical protein